MIPQQLLLRNFMCYRQAAGVDFAGIRLACISGDNGHGKSALLDAITWALWGRARARTDDELIHVGETEMEVEFRFLLGDATYRVIRKRTRAKGGQTVLELQVLSGDSFRAITGNTVRETERRIVDLLHMEYETFINSTFLLQGRADEFTVKSPTERKRILAEILGLSLYDALEERAREQARLHDATAREIAAAIREMDQELAHRPEHEGAFAAGARQVAELSDSLRAGEAALRDLREERALLEGKARQAADLRLRLDSLRGELAEAQRNLTDHSRRLAEHESLAAQGPEIEQGYADLAAARREVDAYGSKLAVILHLNQEKARLEQTIASQRHTLDGQAQVLSVQAAERRKLSAQAGALSDRLGQAQAQLARLEGLSKDRDAARDSLLALSNQAAGLRTTNDQLRAEMLDLKRKMDELAGVDQCPLCETDLSPERRDLVRRQYEAEGRQKGDAHRANEADLARLDGQMAALKAQAAQAAAELHELPSVQKQEATLAQALSQARLAGEELAGLEGRLAAVQSRLAAQDFAGDARALLAGILRQIEAAGYDQAGHEAAQRRAVALTPFELRKTYLDTARSYLDEDRATVARYQEQTARYQQNLEVGLRELATWDSALTGLAELARRVTARQAEVDELQVRERRARLELGAAQQRLDACARLAELRKHRSTQAAQAANEKGIFDELALAFGKKGVQAMLIEEALPELEESANQLLARMTDGRLHVHFDTQRETKKGDTIETLDIKIADELGTRNYETYSGGEAYRVNFAVRVALSKLLANRAGARLQTLVLDEGFGTQDAQGRERLVEAINSIQDDFQMILAITHIQELKDAFPVHIEVTKTAEGSSVVIA